MNLSTHQIIEIDGHRIAYEQHGEGSAVVLLHGIPTSRLLWRNVMPELAKTHQVFAPDMLNYGQSEKPVDANVSIEAQSRLIVKFMEQLELDSADIVAHDIGGGVAQLIAVNYPERVRKLVLIDTVCFDSWPNTIPINTIWPSSTSPSSRNVCRGFRNSVAPRFESTS